MHMALTASCPWSLVGVLDSAEIMSDTSRARLFGNLDELTTTS